MYNFQSMRVVNRTHHLLENSSCSGLVHAAIVDNKVEELSFGVFNNHNYVCCSGDNLITKNNGKDRPGRTRETSRDSQFDNMGMAQET